MRKQLEKGYRAALYCCDEHIIRKQNYILFQLVQVSMMSYTIDT